jgi:hypothetical protein
LVKPKARFRTVDVTADDEGLVSHAGTALLAELADRAGLTDGLSEALAGTRERRSAHDPGWVLVDVAVTLADGRDCVTDLDAYGGQERLFGARASETTTHRVLKSVDEPLLDAIRAARAGARSRVWNAGARPDTITLNIDATLLTAHSEKQRAAEVQARIRVSPTGVLADETGEPLAAILRPGNAGSNTARITSRCSAWRWSRSPPPTSNREMLARADIGGCTHAFTADCRDAGIRFSVGYELTDTVRQAILEAPEAQWEQAIDADRGTRRGMGVRADRPTGLVRLAGGLAADLPTRAAAPRRAISDLRRARLPAHLLAHRPRRHRHRRDGAPPPRPRPRRRRDPRRQGHWHAQPPAPTPSLTTRPGWELSLIAQDLLCWTKLVCLRGELTKAEPNRLRNCLLHTAGKLVSHGRRTHLKLDRDWPWSDALAAAFHRLRATPQLC